MQFHQKPQKTRGVIRSRIRLIHPDVLAGSAIGLTVAEFILFLAYRSYVPMCGFDGVKPALRLTILAAPVLVGALTFWPPVNRNNGNASRRAAISPTAQTAKIGHITSMPLTLKITEQERAKRLGEVRQALASVRLEGLEPGHEAHSIYQRYVDGELTLEQMGAEIEALHDREYGPVPVPRNGRP